MESPDRDDTHVEQHGDGDVNISGAPEGGGDQPPADAPPGVDADDAGADVKDENA